ncbi:hypothetical protein [Streptomyces stelliscabiei]|uniref:hypothetical protein n=1 Tax=Streptomyces stelliscabiei TaxID=146820 RepID=UPI002FF2A630
MVAFEVALLQKVVPASEDLQKDLVDHLFGDGPVAEVDFRDVVEMVAALAPVKPPRLTNVGG